MAKKFFSFVAVVIIIVLCVVFNSEKGGFMTAGIGNEGESLMSLNKKDTTKVNIVSFTDAEVSDEGVLAELTSVAGIESMRNGLYFGADAIFTVSSQFGVMCPTNDIRFGLDFGSYRLEAKAGNYTRNTVKTMGFDPQFQNNLILLGESASASNAIQLSFLSKNTKVFVGHQGGSKFYKFDGNYYVGAEQNIKNLVALSGGVNFTEKTSGYAAAKLTCKNNVVTATANNIGTENKSFVLSYNRTNINIGKGVKMNLGTAFWTQPEKQGLRMVAGLNKGRFNLFAQAGGFINGAVKPMWGLGGSCNL